MPKAHCLRSMRDIDDVNEKIEHAEAFVFDAFGVLNVGETLIEGAD